MVSPRQVRFSIFSDYFEQKYAVLSTGSSPIRQALSVKMHVLPEIFTGACRLKMIIATLLSAGSLKVPPSLQSDPRMSPPLPPTGRSPPSSPHPLLHSIFCLLPPAYYPLSPISCILTPMPTCANCGSPYEPPIYRGTQCGDCGRELKTCRNCRHFAPGAPNDCREPSAEPPAEKDRANFCGWFSPAEDAGSSRGAGAGGADAADAVDAARAAFNSLFGDD